MHRGDGGNTTREDFSQAHGWLMPPRRSTVVRSGTRRGISASHGDLPGTGWLSTLGWGCLRGCHCKGLLSLYGGKIRSWWGKHQQDPPQPCGFAAPLTLWVPTLPTPSPDLPVCPGDAQLRHHPNTGHPAAAARRFLFKAQLPLFLAFCSFPSATGIPSASAGQQSITSKAHPDPPPAQTQPGNKTFLRAKIKGKLCGPKPSRG